jgi:hypothetical protein
MPRHKSTERPPAGRNVSIERHGKVHEGTYTVDGSMVTVNSLMLGTKSSHIGGSAPEALAKVLLTELLEAEERRNRT